jgi:hypothetical protein
MTEPLEQVKEWVKNSGLAPSEEFIFPGEYTAQELTYFVHKNFGRFARREDGKIRIAGVLHSIFECRVGNKYIIIAHSPKEG